VDPDIAVIDRVDQTVTWRLNASNLAWNPRFPNQAIRFATPKPPYDPWPGQPPRPVGPPPSHGEHDRRDYTADAKAPMPDGKFEVYAYDIAVVNIVTGEEIHVQVRRSPDQLERRGAKFAELARRTPQPRGGGEGEDNDWYDPDIENRPQP
jgi:hypothetical protein